VKGAVSVKALLRGGGVLRELVRLVSALGRALCWTAHWLWKRPFRQVKAR